MTTSVKHRDEDSGDVEDKFRSLMEGLRTSLPGVQVLFAFLLTVPLQPAFADLSSWDRAIFATAFLGAGLASILLIAPSVHQRLRAPISGLRRESMTHLKITIWVAVAGSIVMGVAMMATVLFVSRIVFAANTAVAAFLVVTGVLCWAWFYLPLVTFNVKDDA